MKRTSAKTAPVATGWKPWQGWLVATAALIAVFESYGPALGGPFLLDDLYLPFADPTVAEYSMERWMARRHVLMLSYFANFKLSGTEPYWYHVANVMLHWLTATMVFLILRAALRPRSDILAGFGALLFLLHPIQTEAVAYVAGRSDVLSTLFAYAALAVFLARRDRGVGGKEAAAIFVLYVLGVLTKEPVVVLPVVFVTLDLLWGGVKKNWRLHVPMALGGVLATAAVLRQVLYSGTTGFSTGIPWRQYLFTQCRAIWLYLRLVVLPAGQNADRDFPLSRSVTDHGAWIGMAALVALALGAVWVRRRVPLASAGVLVFLILLAPTSSIFPINDLIAERRMYFPFVGLLLVLMEGARRIRLSHVGAAGAMAVALLGCAVLTYARAGVWSSETALWTDTVEKSPDKWRPRFQLAYAYYRNQRCPEASREFARAAQMDGRDPRLLIDWALALDCEGKPEEALAQLRRAAAHENSAHVHALIGMVLGKQRRAGEALAELALAEKLDSGFVMTYAYRGNVYASRGEWQLAVAEYRKVLAKEPANQMALRGLELAQAQLRAPR